MTRIPSDLARFGLVVELVPGWETRGSSSFAPAGVVNHWTAGPRGTTGRPSLSVVTNGRADLSGPLCNVYLDRRGVCVVVAAGRANHAGLGGFRGLVGNSAVYGIEAECGGDGDWTPEMLAAYPRLNAALLSGLSRDASWVIGHNEWAPDRKIDIRDVIGAVRNDTAAVLANPGDDMPLSQDDLNKISVVVRDWAPSAVTNPTTIDWGKPGKTSVAQTVADTYKTVAAMAGQLAGLTAAVQTLASGGGVDLAQIEAASKKGTAEALAGFEATVVIGAADGQPSSGPA